MKITKVILHNYRGFKHEEFDFNDGLNTIIGKTDAGKSALLKGIDFVVSNNQKGNSISNWILNDKGKIIKGESCWVEIHTSDGHIVRRERTPSKNIYIIDGGEPIMNFNQGVPEAVVDIFKMNEINMQTQFETHFMLNDKPSEVAKTLNKMVNLEVIDESISNASKILRKIKKQKDASDINLKKYKEGIEKFNFLEAMEKDIEELSTLQEEENQLSLDKQRLEEIAKSIKQYQNELNEIEEATKNRTLVDEILVLYSELEELDNTGMKLHNISESILGIEKELKEIDDIFSNKKLAEDIIKLMDDLSSKKKEYNSLADIGDNIEEIEKELKVIKEIKSHTKLVEEILELYEDKESLMKDKKKLKSIQSNIKKYEEELDEISEDIKDSFSKIKGQACPSCGQIIKGDINEIC